MLSNNLFPKGKAENSIANFGSSIQQQMTSIQSTFSKINNNELTRAEGISFIKTCLNNCINIVFAYTAVLKVSCAPYNDTLSHDINRFHNNCQKKNFSQIPFSATARLAKISIDLSDLGARINQQLQTLELHNDDRHTLLIKYLSFVGNFIRAVKPRVERLPEKMNNPEQTNTFKPY